MNVEADGTSNVSKFGTPGTFKVKRGVQGNSHFSLEFGIMPMIAFPHNKRIT